MDAITIFAVETTDRDGSGPIGMFGSKVEAVQVAEDYYLTHNGREDVRVASWTMGVLNSRSVIWDRACI